MIPEKYVIHNPKEFAEKAKNFLKNIKTESIKAREIAEKEYDISRIAKRYIKLYQRYR